MRRQRSRRASRAAVTLRLSPLSKQTLIWPVVGLFAALIVVPMAAGSGTAARPYQGGFVDDPEASVRFDVTVKDGVAKKAKFEAVNFAVVCEGEDSPRRMSFGPMSVRFVGPRVFEGRERPIPQDDGFQYLSKFEGRLLGGGRANGFVFYREDDYDPPAGTENLAECSTDGLLRWKAERVR